MTEPQGGEFGAVIKAWFAKNGWPQIVAEQVARAKGSKIGPWASQMSNCMQGKLTPKPDFFVAMGWFNNVILTRDFQGITDRRLMDRLLGSEALTHEDGQPYTATCFFSLYVGEHEAPKEFSQPPATVTQEDVDQWARDLRELFHATVMDLVLPARDVWQLIEDSSIQKGMALEDLMWLREVVTGLINPTLEEILRQCTKYPVDQFELACVEVCKGEACRQKAQDLYDFVMSKKALMPNQADERVYPNLAGGEEHGIK